MKLSFILCVATIFHLSATVYSQTARISLSMQNVKIEDVLDKIEEQSEFYFLYNQKLVDMSRQVSIHVADQTINEVLNRLFDKEKVDYVVHDRQIIVAPAQSINQLAQVMQQSITITGTITDETGEPMPGVNVVIKGTSAGVVTGVDGRYSINVSDRNTVLQFSFMGYIMQELAVGDQTEIDLIMEEDAREIEEVVVIGYGELSKKKLSTAVSKVAGKDINRLPVTTPGDALAGLAAGVQIQSGTGGTPGGTPTIRIRGAGSLGATNDPLYVVDGYPLQDASHFHRVNVSDIESIEILKDAASAAIYGSRAANGVIIVTTKRGKAEKMSFNVSAFTGVSQVAKRMEVMNKDEYLKYSKDARNTAGLQYPDIHDTPELLPDTDWQDVIFRTAPLSEIQINAQGGTEKTQFSVSGSYLKQDGTIVGTDYQLGTFRANIDATLYKSLKIGINFAPSFTRQNEQPAAGGVSGPASYVPVYAALLMPPVVPVRLENGDYGQNNVMPYTQYGFSESGIHNPLAVLELNENQLNSFTLLNNAYLQWEPVKGLVLRTQGGASVRSAVRETYIPSTLAYATSPYANLSTPSLAGISSQETSYRTLDWVWENMATYTLRLSSGHNLSTMLLYSMQKYKATTTSTRGTTGTYTNDLVHNSTASTAQIGGLSYGLNSFMSYAARINYDYKDKYIFSAAIRTDASSRFGADQRFGTFPSFSAGWRITKESFMENQNIFSELKIRGSYGETGNANIGDFTWMSSIGTSNYSFNSERVSGTYQTGYMNEELTWEKNRQVDLGLEAAFLRDRIYLSVDVYEKTTHGMLFSKELPGVIGYATTFQTNIGKLKNQGIEIVLNTRNFTGEFQWNTDFNISYNKSEVLDLGGRESLDTRVGTSGWSNVYQVRVGEPLGNMYGFIIDGVFKSQEELDESVKWSGSGVGSFKIRNVNNDDSLDEGDRTLLGNGFPDYVFGMTNNFSYRNFDLSFILQGVLGSNVINGAARHTELWAGRFNAVKDMVDNYFIASDPDRDVKYGQVGTRSGFSTAGQLSSYAVYSGAFLRVRNITLGYTLPAEISKKIFLQSARIYLSAQNLFTFTKYPGFNPEPSQYGDSVYQPGSDQGTYPANRTFLIGLNISF